MLGSSSKRNARDSPAWTSPQTQPLSPKLNQLVMRSVWRNHTMAVIRRVQYCNVDVSVNVRATWSQKRSAQNLLTRFAVSTTSRLERNRRLAGADKIQVLLWYVENRVVSHQGYREGDPRWRRVQVFDAIGYSVSTVVLYSLPTASTSMASFQWSWHRLSLLDFTADRPGESSTPCHACQYSVDLGPCSRLGRLSCGW